MAVCTATDLPLASNARTARDQESIHALALIDKARERGFAVETAAMDKGYDITWVYDGCEDRDVRPVIPLKGTPAVKFGQHKPPTGEHGEGGSQGLTASAARASGAARLASASPRHAGSRLIGCTLIPRETPRFTALYRRRAAVEREFGRLKNEWALAPLRVRGLDRVRLRADLTILAKLACALSRARGVPLAA
jgi:hypothetical protein